MRFVNALCPIALAFRALTSVLIASDSQQYPAQDSTRSISGEAVSFPPGAGEATILSLVLGPLREPSLFESARDASILSYRWTYFSFVPHREILIRLDVNANGSGQILSAVSEFGKSTTRRNETVSVADVEKFLKVIEPVGFWSMSSSAEKKTGGDKMYELDGSCSVVEGVRSGSFHYVFRRNPKPSSFTEVGRYLARNLARIDNSVLPNPPFPSADQ
jgi:hypothetical protein